MGELRDSHIVSKFLWLKSGLFDKQKQYKVACLTDAKVRLPDLQNGFTEALLCSDCELKFGRWETYCAPIYTNKKTPLHGLSDGQFIVGNLNYDKLKLFVMSILWRMSIGSHPFYSRVMLGASKNELLRQALNAEIPFGWKHYGCIFTVIKEGSAIFTQPFTLCFSRFTSVNIVIAGVHWTIFVDGKPNAMEEEFF